jgi:alcohol dehydrogenase class IV
MTEHASITGTWTYPTQVRFGPGRIAELADACAGLGMTRPLLVTDAGLGEHPMVLTVLAALEEDMPTTLFCEVRPNPVAANVEAGVAAYAAGGHDGVIAMGGGSGLDAGKAIALMAKQDVSLWDLEDIGDNWTRARADVIPPIVAVPTTAGTGSETGRAAVITNPESGIKTIVFHPRMLPGAVIADPQLTLGLPPAVTAATGMDALSHCLEAFCVAAFHPMADGIALEGMRLIRDWLPKAVAHGADLEARAHMMAAACMGSTAFQKGLGAIHSLSHPVGSVYDTHHGLANAVFMPYAMAFNRRAIADKMARLGRYMGLDVASFDGVLEWVLALRAEIGIPHGAAELGVEAARLDDLAAMAARDPTAATNPVPAGVAEMRRMFEAALAGEV